MTESIKEREICERETLQIGAILLNETYQEIGQFHTLIKPQYNEIVQDSISKLTGITTESVSKAPEFVDALTAFLQWCLKFENPRIYAWSESDKKQLLREIALKKISLSSCGENLIEGIYDFQFEFTETLGLENSVSLGNALSYADIDFEGHQHDALDDARNTANLLRIVRTPELRAKALENVIEILKPKAFGASMGDFFKFSNFEEH